MSYNFPGAAAGAGRLQTDPRRWLLQVAQRSAAVPAQWAREITPRRAIVVAAIAGIALGAGLAGQGTGQGTVGYRDAIEIAGSNAASTSVAPPTVGSDTGLTVPILSPTSPAESSLAALASPGYALTTSVAAALSDVRSTVADTVALQQLRAQIVAPAPVPGLSSAVLNDLASLVRQAQVSSVPITVPAAELQPLDTTALSKAEADVQAAQAALVAATKARDGALAAGLPAPTTATPSATAPATVVAARSAATASAADPAVVHDAQARLASAQQHLQSLLAGPSPDAVQKAEQAVSGAVASAPAAPTADQISEAKSAVAAAQKEYDAASQPASAVSQPPATRPTQAGKPSDSTRNQPTSGVPTAPDPVAARADPVAAGALVGVDAQRLSDTKANLDSAQAALAALQQQAAVAGNPESQPAVIAARKNLAALTAPADPAAVASAQAVVASIQQQLAALSSQGSPNVATSAAVTATAVPSVAAATPAAATAAAPAGTAAASTTGTAAASDPVAAAAQRLTDAQQRLRDAVVPQGAQATTGTASVPAAALPPLVTAPAAAGATAGSVPAGSTATQTTPEIQAEAARLASTGQVSKNDLTTMEVGLRARYVMDAVLGTEHLHPSAFPLSPTAALASAGSSTAGTTGVTPALAWPVHGPITQPFGVPELGVGAPHTGIDIGVPIGTPVTAAASGVVTFAGGDPATGYGYYAIIDHGTGVSTLYGHLALPPFLHPGQFLPQGGLIGLSGSTGFSTGPHVHFEVRLNSVPVDPMKVLVAAGSH